MHHPKYQRNLKVYSTFRKCTQSILEYFCNGLQLNVKSEGILSLKSNFTVFIFYSYTGVSFIFKACALCCIFSFEWFWMLLTLVQSCLLPVLNSEAHFEKLAQNEIIMLMSCKIFFFLYNREYITDKRVSIQNVACSH